MGYIGRNDPCHCGSGKKYKKCCLQKDDKRLGSIGEDENSIESAWGYELFGARFPEIAEKETRSITVMDGGRFCLPEGTYVFHEMFCSEHDCDCRRVFFYVISEPRHKVGAVVCYGWESAAFYKKWYNGSDPDMISEMRGPALNVGSPQSNYAPAILKLVKTVLIKDRDYMERVKRHYAIFKIDVDKRSARG